MYPNLPVFIPIPIVADINVGRTKVTGTATVNRYATGPSFMELRQLAIFNAVSSVDADFLINIMYAVERNMRPARTTVTVTGYPATYVNFRQITPQLKDLLNIELGEDSVNDNILVPSILPVRPIQAQPPPVPAQPRQPAPPPPPSNPHIFRPVGL
jgi:hypothetical protein